MARTAWQHAQETFGPYVSRNTVTYAYTDETGTDLWSVTCGDCGGNGYDIETEGFSCCETCEGLGEWGPFEESEVSAYL